MADSRHRRPRRRRGVALRSGHGRRRQSGVLEEDAQSPRELNRSARRVNARRARRKVILATVGAALIVIASVFVSWVVLNARDSGDEQGLAVPSGASALVVITDGAGTATSVALFGSDEGFPAEAVLFPPALLTTVPGFGEGELAQTTRFGGPDLVEITLMNLVGVDVHATAVIDGADLASALTEPVEVDLPNPLVVGQVVVAAEGSALRDPDQVVALMTEQGTGDQLAWLVRQGAVWDGLLGVLSEDPDSADDLLSDASGDPVGVRRALLAVASDPQRQIVAAPVTRVERAGGDVEVYQLSGEEAAALATSQFAYVQLAEEPRVRLEILNGNGLVGTTRLVADRLIREGFRVVRTDNADAFTYTTTRVIAQGRNHQQSALEIRDLLNLGEVEVEQRQPSGVVDVTIIVGSDLPAGSSDS